MQSASLLRTRSNLRDSCFRASSGKPRLRQLRPRRPLRNNLGPGARGATTLSAGTGYVSRQTMRTLRQRRPCGWASNEVNLIFTVTDKHGHYIPNLKLNDFALLDDQRAPEKVTSFRQQINLPLRVGIVIDASTSIRTRFQFEQQSATEFLLDILKAAAIAPLSWASM